MGLRSGRAGKAFVKPGLGDRIESGPAHVVNDARYGFIDTGPTEFIIQNDSLEVSPVSLDRSDGAPALEAYTGGRSTDIPDLRRSDRNG